MSSKLAEEREKARKYLLNPQNNQQKSPCSFNLSDLRQEKTLHMDKTPNRSGNSPFDSKEISARSTTFHRQANKFGSELDFDEIMKTSHSQAVRNKYRESMSMGRLSSLPKTADVSLRTSMGSRKTDIWDAPQQSFSSFAGKNLTYSNEDFKPAEEMVNQLDKDEKDQEMEYAAIPGRQEPRETSNWEDSVARGRLPEMSFGQYCFEKIRCDDIRDIYGKESPKKKSNRVALVELSTNESTNEQPPNSDPKKLEKNIKSNKSPQAEGIANNFSKKFKDLHHGMAQQAGQYEKNKQPFSGAICQLMESLNFDRIMKNAEIERSRMALEEEKKRTKLDVVPVKDDTIEGSDADDENMKYESEMQNEFRGLKRRPSSLSNDTPKSTLGKCLRSKSPNNMKELQAAQLKPRILLNESVFKVPFPSNSTLKSSQSSGVSSMSKSPTNLSSYKTNSASSSVLPQSSSSLSREYLTAKDHFSMRSPDEKLSLPNYALQRPSNSTHISPSSSVRSIARWSPTGANEGRLRRSASQMSNGSEFGDDFLPIKIKNIENRKLSFESVKIDKSVVKNLSIQNGCDKKLPLRIRVIGSGFSVSPKEDFRMVPMEARTFQVKFSPSIVGPSRGALIFELATNKNCSKTIPLYAYGGHANIAIENVQKGPFGPQFLTMGCVKDLNYSLEQKLRLRNNGTLPAFASLVFERTKLSDFVILDSLTVEPTQVKIDPGRYTEFKVRFKATKSEIKKIFAMNKEVTTIGEICVICGDEPTRIRILQGKNVVEKRFLDYLPQSLPGENEIIAKLLKFKEDLTCEKVSAIMSSIKTHEIALTINRDMNDTQCLSAEISLADDTHMSFETFVDTNYTRINTNMIDMDHLQQSSMEMFESKYFHVYPSTIRFNRFKDVHGTQKFIEIESTCDEDLLIEAISTHSKLVSVSLSRGKIKFGEKTEIRVTALSKAFEHHAPINVIILIRNARVEVPVKFIE